MLEALIGFLSGIGLAVFGALINSAVQSRRERKRRTDAALFEVYMMLLELNSSYFWLASAELQGTKIRRRTRKRIHELAWRIADRLRQDDQVPFLDEIIEVLMSEPAYESARARHDALSELVSKVGQEANPRYSKVISKISQQNISSVMSRRFGTENAPALLSPLTAEIPDPDSQKPSNKR